MMRALLLTAFLLVTSIVHAGTEVNNGAGLSEQNLVYAFSNFAALVQVCIETPVCGLAPVSQMQLQKLSLVLNRPNLRLRFVREAELPARRYQVLGSAGIWQINGDRLWQDQALTVPYDLAAAVDLLLTIADEHLGLLSPTLTEPLLAYLRSSSRSLTFGLTDQLQVHFLFWQNRARLVVRAESGDAVDLTQMIDDHLKACAGDVSILDPIYQGFESDQNGVEAHFLLRARNSCMANWLSLSLGVGVGVSALTISSVSELDGSPQ